jgi:hypothetical protein
VCQAVARDSVGVVDEVVKELRATACHAEVRGFEPRRSRQFSKDLAGTLAGISTFPALFAGTS